MMKKSILVLLSCFLATAAFADTQPFQLSLIPDVAIHGKTTHIQGVTLGIWGENPQTALAVGVVNGSTGESSGISLGFLANYAESYQGAHLAWIANYSSARFHGDAIGSVQLCGEIEWSSTWVYQLCGCH